MASSGRVANAPAAMGSRWRFVLYNPVSLRGMPRLQQVAEECRAHVVLYSGTRLRSRENREYHTEQVTGTSLWMEKMTVHELFRTVHDDLFTTNKEKGPPLHCAGTNNHCGKRENGETAKRAIGVQGSE